MAQPKKKDPMPRLCLHCDADTAALLKRISVAENTTMSELIRRLVHQGMEANGFQEAEDQLQAHVQAAIKEVIKPYMERLAAITAKSTQIAAASFFMEAYIFGLLFPGQNQAIIQEAAVKARSVGAEYASLKPGDELDAFIREALNMRDKGTH